MPYICPKCGKLHGTSSECLNTNSARAIYYSPALAQEAFYPKMEAKLDEIIDLLKQIIIKVGSR